MKNTEKDIELHSCLIKAIVALGYSIESNVDELRIIEPKTKQVVFKGDMDQAQDWLIYRDHHGEQRLQIKIKEKINITEEPYYFQNCCFCFIFCTAITIVNLISPLEVVSNIIGAFGLILFFIGLQNMLKYFTFVKNRNSKLSIKPLDSNGIKN